MTVVTEARPDHRPALRRVLAHPAVLAVGALGLALRIWILLSPPGALSADEAYTGLQAIDITRGNLAIVIGGAGYTGTLDTYLLGPILQLAGQPVVLLKLMSPVLWALAAVAMTGSARRFVDDRMALVAGGFVWLAPGALAILSTRSYVAYALGLVLIVSTFWVAAEVIGDDGPPRLVVVTFGALAGLAFYTHPMFACVVAPVAVVVAARHRRNVVSVWVPAALAALAVNLPFLAWNAKNSWPSLDQPVDTSGSTYTSRLRGFFSGLLPRDLGVRRLGIGDDWVLGKPIGLLVVLLVLALAAAGVTFTWRADPWRGALLGAPLLFVWPLMAGLSNLAFVADGRYGIVAFTPLVVAVVAGLGGALSRLRSLPSVALVAWLALCVLPFLRVEAGTDLGDPNRETQALVDAIHDAGFDRVAGNYFAVLPIEYQSHSTIRVAVAGNPFVVRFPETQRMVDATAPDRLAYVFAPGPVDPTWVKLPLETYRQVPMGAWVLYFPN